MPNNLIDSDLTVKGRASYLILLQTVNDLNSAQPDAPSSLNVARAAADDIKRLKDDLSSVGRETLLSHRCALIEAFGEIFTLNLYTDAALDWVIHGSLLHEAALIKENAPKDGGELFLTHLQAMLDISDMDNGIASKVLSQSVSHVPLRMASTKYKDYISDAFKKLNEVLDAGEAEYFSRFFNPMEALKGTEWLNNLRKPLDEIWEKDCAAMNIDGINADFNIISVQREKITKLLDYLCLLFDGVTAAFIAQKHCPKELINDETRGFSEKQLDEAIEGELKKITYGPESEIPYGNDELQAITDMFFETGLEYFNVTDGGRDAADDMDGFLSAFLPCLDAPEITANRRRFLRQHLMAYFPYPYSVEKYKKYFLDTYAALDDANRKYMLAYVAMQVNEAKQSQEK